MQSTIIIVFKLLLSLKWFKKRTAPICFRKHNTIKNKWQICPKFSMFFYRLCWTIFNYKAYIVGAWIYFLRFNPIYTTCIHTFHYTFWFMITWNWVKVCTKFFVLFHLIWSPWNSICNDRRKRNSLMLPYCKAWA